MTDTLKPCPFCGGEAETNVYGATGEWTVNCPCGAEMNRRVYTEAEAIEAWNTRAHKPFVLMNGVAFCCECGTCIGRHDDHYSECPSCGAKVATKDFSLCNEAKGVD